jgi:hypothetical protein
MYSVESVIMEVTEESQKGAFSSHIRHKFIPSQDACHGKEEQL